MLRIDNRTPDNIKAIITFVTSSTREMAYCMSPSSLRKQFDKLEVKLQAMSDKVKVDNNRNWALKMKERYPEAHKKLSFDANYVRNIENGNDLSFALPVETFKPAFIKLFGGEVHGR